jgi:hypothetical protein
MGVEFVEEKAASPRSGVAPASSRAQLLIL